MSEITAELLCKALSKFPAAVKILEKHLQNGDSPQIALAKLSKAKDQPWEAHGRVQYLEQLLELSEHDSKLGNQLLSDDEASNLGQIGLKYSLEQDSDPQRVISIEKLRRNLIKRDSTGVILAAIKLGIIELSEELQTATTAVLQSLVASGRSISGNDVTPLVGHLVSEDVRAQALSNLNAFRRLSSIAVEPEDINVLLKTDYTSAKAIAQNSLPRFILNVEDYNMTKDRALEIHANATTVEMRNDQAWISILKSKQNDFKLSSLPQEIKSIDDGRKASFDMTSMFQIEYEQCTSCCSITGLNAYFVNLLTFLQNEYHSLPVVATKDGTAPNTAIKPQKGPILNVLLQRRPDLVDMELSCANSDSKIPYITLVNEVMESFVAYLATNPEKRAFKDMNKSIRSFNTTGDQEDNLASISTNVEVYKGGIALQMHPFPKFPYNLAEESIALLLDARGLSMRQLKSLFWSPGAIARQVGKDMGASCWEPGSFFTKYVQLAHRRKTAASILNLSQEDFLAITQESFWPTEGFEAIFGLPLAQYIAERNPKFGVGALWGYKDLETPTLKLKADDVLVDDVYGYGLSFLKDQLLTRSNLNADDLLTLLETDYLYGRLVIVPANGSRKTDGSLYDMRLRASVLNKEPGKLTVELCQQLQAFIRLQQKLGWSLTALDRVLSVIKTSLRESGVKFERDGIDAVVLCELSALIELSELADVESATLLPLWADIDTKGPSSTYSTLFLQRQRGRSKNAFDNFLSDCSSIGEHWADLTTTFRVTNDELAALLKVARLKMDDQLTVPSASAIYRWLLLTRLLEVPAKYSGLIESIAFKTGDPFRNPTATLTFFRTYRHVVPDTKSLSSIKTLLDGVSASPDRKKINTLLEILQSTTLAGEDGKMPTEKSISALAAELFGSSHAESVTALINGSHVSTVSVRANVAELLEQAEAETVPSAFSHTENSISFRGTMSEAHKEKLLSLANGDMNFQRSIQELFTKATGLFNMHIRSIMTPDQLKQLTRVTHLFASSEITTPSASNGAMASDEVVLNRRRCFASIAPPKLAEVRLREDFIRETRELFPQLDGSVVVRCLDNTQWLLNPTCAPNAAPKSLASLALQCFFLDRPTSVNSGYFLFPENQSKMLSICVVSSGSAPAQLTVDGVQLTAQRNGEAWVFASPATTSGKTHLLQSNFDLMEAEMLFEDGSSYDLEDCVHVATHEWPQIQHAINIMNKSLQLAEYAQLTAEEIAFFFSGNHSLRMNIEDLTIQDIRQLRLYVSLRDATEPQSKGLLTLLKSVTREVSTKDLSPLIVSCTGWPAQQVAQILRVKYGKVGALAFLRTSSVMDDLQAIQDILQILSKNKSLETDAILSSLCENATAKRPFIWEADYACAKALNDAIVPFMDTAAQDAYAMQLQTSRRDALVQYLLRQDFFVKRHIIDGDGLLEYFLIDVQMGPQLKTSRTKQAISTVQYFVTRCLLGLEVAQGVHPSDIPIAKWEWRSKHDLWAANRKLLLYPENWIEPSLRDYKSEAFKAFEAAIMQNDLTEEGATMALRDYVRGLNEIADLDIHAYLRDMSSTEDCFHFFARSKTLPPQTYHRKMSFLGNSKSIFWSPWSKMDLDIPSPDTDWNGATLERTGAYLIPVVRAGRIYLFVPEIVLKTLPMDTNEQVSIPATTDSDGKVLTAKRQEEMTMEHMAKRPIKKNQSKKLWEIKMAWSECVAGVWSSKQTSTSVLQVSAEKHSNHLLPSVAHFHFCVSEQEEIATNLLSLDVACWYEDGKHLNVGKFELRNDRITATSVDTFMATDIEPLRTSFSRLTIIRPKEVTSKVSSNRRYGPRTLQPLLAVPQEQTRQDTPLTFTLSYNESEPLENMRLCGLIVDINQERVRGETLFAYSRAGFNLNTTSEDLTKHSTLERTNYQLVPEFMRLVNSEDFIPKVLGAIRVPVRAPPEGATEEEIAQLLADQLFEKASMFGGHNGKSMHELSSPYALYNWELSVHCLMLIADKFKASKSYDLALKYLRLMYNPSVDSSKKGECWSFQVFKDIAEEKPEALSRILETLRTASPGVGVAEQRRSTASPHAAARSRPVAYMKRIMSTYVSVLIAYGDEYFRQGVLEAVPLAIQRYIEAAHILGPEPPQRPKMGKWEKKSFRGVTENLMDLELEFPFTRELGSKRDNEASVTQEELRCIVSTSYFCIPPNPELIKLRNLLKNRLYNIRNSLDIDGRPIEYALVDPDLDPGALVNALGGALGITSQYGMTGQITPMPSHRFMHILQRALEACSDFKAISEQYLTAREKKDAEALASIRARQESLILKMTMEMKQNAKKEIEITIRSLKHQRESLANRLRFQLESLGEPASRVPAPGDPWRDIDVMLEKPSGGALRLTKYEQDEISTAATADILNMVAGEMDLRVAGLFLAPNMTENVEPMGMGVSLKFDGNNLGQSLSTISGFTRGKAQMFQERGARGIRKLQYIRQLQERQTQVNMLGNEIKGIDYQVQIQDQRLEMHQKEQAIYVQQVADNAEMQKWYQTKFSNEKLYDWLENSLKSLQKEYFNLAVGVARHVERVYAFEKGEAVTTSLDAVKWDPQREGLLASQHLQLSLRKMESQYLERPNHDYEILKCFSVRNIDPFSLVTLRETGSATFSIPELLFDVDFPGHYMRRIKAVSVTIPCLTGPYTSIAATLTLTKHQYRVSPMVAGSAEYIKLQQENSAFRTDRIPISSVAISSGMNDSGVFDFNFRNEAYLPFEGAGAISEWKIELPTEIRHFDYQSISDVILNMRYTSKDGGGMLKKAANDSVAAYKVGAAKLADSGQLTTLSDIASDFSATWYHFTSDMKAGRPASLTLDRLTQRLPFWTSMLQLKPQAVKLVVSPARDDWGSLLKLSACTQEEWKSGTLGPNCTILSGEVAGTEALDTWKLSCSPSSAMDVLPEKVTLLVSFRTRSSAATQKTSRGG